MEYMKRYFLIMTIMAMTCLGCKSPKETVVNATASLDSEANWKLVAMHGKAVRLVEGMKPITIHFNLEAGTFSGSSGCNRYFGNFKDLGEQKMKLSEFNGTKMACPESFHKIENGYMQLLRRCDAYRVGEYTLELMQGENVLLSFEKE